MRSGYAVVYEFPVGGRSDGSLRIDLGLVSSLHADDAGRSVSALDAAENQLAYCLGMQRERAPWD